MHRKTKLKTITCYAYNYILKQQIVLVRRRETITIAGHVMLMNSKILIRYNTSPAYNSGVFNIRKSRRNNNIQTITDSKVPLRGI